MEGYLSGIGHNIIAKGTEPKCVCQQHLPEKTKAFLQLECDKMRVGGVIEQSSLP